MIWSGNEIPIVLGACFILFGLIGLSLLSKISRRLADLVKVQQNSAAQKPVQAALSPSPPSGPSPVTAVDPGERGKLIAAVSAAIAEDLGTDVSQIRILSFKPV